MGYQMGNMQWARTQDVTLEQAGTVKTATYNGTALELGDKGTMCLTLDSTAVSGTTPSMTVAIETSADGTTWRAVASFTAQTATASERKSFTGLDRFVRAAVTISGTTPSFTFGLTGDAK